MSKFRLLVSSYIRPLPSILRGYATVGATTYLGKPPKTPTPPVNLPSAITATTFDHRVLSALDGTTPSLPTLVDQYIDRSGEVLDVSLPYESRPTPERKTFFDSAEDNGVYMIAHALQHAGEHKVSVCSGFALNVTDKPVLDEDTYLVTCAHTLEEMRHSSLMSKLLSNAGQDDPIATGLQLTKSGSLIVSGSHNTPSFRPVSSIRSAMHRSDLILLATPKSTTHHPLRTLPISPYPAQPETPIRAHFVVDKKPDQDGWRPWIGGTWSKWVKGKVLGYRDFAGREAKPGTYDALSHLLFEPLPTPGSSGGPIVDAESGAVIGVVLGTRMDSGIEGVRGWGVPSETIFEMFSLPGLKLKSKQAKQ